MARKSNITKSRKLIAEAGSLIAVVYDESKGKRRAQLGNAEDACVEARSALYRLR
jgi:hypothetical protein